MKATKKATKPASTLTKTQLNLTRTFAALRAHTNKTFQKERSPKERAAQTKRLTQFVNAHRSLPAVQRYLQAA